MKTSQIIHTGTLILVLLTTSILNAQEPTMDPVLRDRQMQEHPGTTPLNDREIIELYSQMIIEVRRGILTVYSNVMTDLIDNVLTGTESSTRVNMGPVIANQLTTELTNQMNRLTAGLPLFSRSYQLLRAMRQERDRAAAASQQFDIISHFRTERQQIQDILNRTLESELYNDILSEYSSLPEDSSRTEFLLRLLNFCYQYRGNSQTTEAEQRQRLSELIPSQHVAEFRTIVRYLNSIRVRTNRQGVIYINIHTGPFTVTGMMGNYRGLEATFPWYEYQNPRSVKFTILAPMGELLEEELNRLRNAHQGLYNSVFDIQVVKVVRFEAREEGRVDALPGNTHIIRYPNGVLGRNNHFRRPFLHPRPNYREAFQRLYQYVESNEAQFQQFGHEYENPNWTPVRNVVFERRL